MSGTATAYLRNNKDRSRKTGNGLKHLVLGKLFGNYESSIGKILLKHGQIGYQNT